MRRWKRTGLTLIELMIVVAIIGFIAAVAIPALLGAVRQDSEGGDADIAPESIAQAPPTATTVNEVTGEVGLAAEIESSDIDVTLRAFEVLEGFSVVTHYDVDFTGAFTIRNPDPEAETVRVVFPFPPGISEARGVSLELKRGEVWEEAEAADYTLRGVEWSGRVAPGAGLEARVRYQARGRGAFGYDVAGTGRSGEVRFEIALEDVERPVVPPDALQPTERSESRLVWSFDKLITNDAIRLELPPGSSPLGRIIFLCQLAGLAVLLFGGGFWFLGEGYRPKMLDDFRWGHFLLLALNFALFFGIFAVIAYDSSPALAMGVAAGVSLPLLTLHVRRVVDTRFALTRNLPLALFSLGVVIAAVYLEELRAYVFLASGVFGVAFVTIRYAAWSEGRRVAREAWEQRAARERRERELEAQLEQLAAQREQLEPWIVRADIALEGSAEELEGERRAARQALDAARGVLDAVRSWGAEGVSEVEETEAHIAAVRGAVTEASSLKNEVMDVEVELREAVARLEVEQDALERSLRAEDERMNDTRRRARVQLDIARRRAGEAEALPEAERVRGAADALGAALEQERDADAEAGLSVRRMQIEDARRELERHLEQLTEALGALERRRDQERERARMEGAVGEEEHCLACGSTRGSGSRFCPDCGTARPLAVDCVRCGAELSLPLHLLEERWSAAPLHCGRCGERYPAETLPEPPEEEAQPR